MPPTALKPETPVPHGSPSLRGLEQLAWLMDRAIRIPGTKITVGIDSILGLLPVGGDVMTGIVQIGIVLVALYRYKVPKPVAARMAANVLVDVLVGAIPFLGDAFDVAFKANTRNIQLLKDVVTEQQEQPAKASVTAKASTLYLVGIGAGLLVVLVLVSIGALTVLGWLLHRPLV